MSYAKKLEDIIEKSGLSLNQIKNKCKVYDVDVTPSYISKLKSSKDPASAKINRAIAQACGADPDELVFEAYMEKAPETVKNFVEGFSKYFLNTTIQSLKLFVPPDQISLVESKISQFTTYEIVKEFNESGYNLPNPFGDSISLKDPYDNDIKV
jgi:transcriptional regulator with XRE-family HTH domain